MIHELTDKLEFPDPRRTREQCVIAVGGDLSVDRLVLAYRSGIFPWILDGETVEWWCPDPRFVLFPANLRVTDSLVRVIKSGKFTVTADKDFRAVIENCRSVKRRRESTSWITDSFVDAYCALHRAGHAHSVEVWQGKELVGGLYGVIAGRCFCGESMFTKISNASKVGFVSLVCSLKDAGFTMIDCQTPSDHLATFGAQLIRRKDFLQLLADTQHSS